MRNSSAVTYLRVKSDLDMGKLEGSTRSDDINNYKDPDAEYQTSFLLQYTTLTRRRFLSQKKRYVSWVWIMRTLGVAMFVGIIDYRMPRTEITAKDRYGLVSYLNAANHHWILDRHV